MKINFTKQLVATALLITGLSAQSYAATLFSDNLQSASDLNALSVTSVGVIGTAQDGTKALTFSALQVGQNMVTTNTYSSNTGSFTVSFDFYSSCNASNNCGGFLNTSAAGWVASDTPFNGTNQFNGTPQFSDSATWKNASITFSGSSTNASFEIWQNSTHAQIANAQGTGASFYIKDLVITDNSVGAANGLVVTTVAAVPEPETYAMLLAGLGLIGAAVKRRKAKQA